jgi:hypothetical protein
MMSNTSNNDISRSYGNITSNIGRTSSMAGIHDMPESKSGTGTIH